LLIVEILFAKSHSQNDPTPARSVKA